MLKNYASGNFFQLIQLHNLEQLLKLLIWEFYITVTPIRRLPYSNTLSVQRKSLNVDCNVSVAKD